MPSRQNKACEEVDRAKDGDAAALLKHVYAMCCGVVAAAACSTPFMPAGLQRRADNSGGQGTRPGVSETAKEGCPNASVDEAYNPIPTPAGAKSVASDAHRVQQDCSRAIAPTSTASGESRKESKRAAGKTM